jgi:xanthine dehydrogenase YagT iron-sulfur-binding subunit
MPDPGPSHREETARSKSGFSRRDFLRGSGAAVAATTLSQGVAETAQAQQAGTKVAPGKATAIQLNINGKAVSVTVEPRVTLLDVLRDDLSLTGAKEACDTANCGSCTVLVDGKAAYACSVLAHQAVGKKIQTAEGLATGENDPVAKCFVKHDATQCGYCTPGFVVATRAFVAAKPNATVEDVAKGLGGNICRCGTYAGVIAAALECSKKGGN